MKRVTICFLLMLFLIVSSKAVYSSGDRSVDAKNLFEQKCSLCHSIDRPKSKKKTETEWKSTVMRMKNVNGAPVTDDEAKMIIKYLSKNHGS